jgi:hypothetical protein
MRGLATWALCLLICAAAVTPAAAGTGGGLYEPFPGKVSKQRVRSFLRQLPDGRRLDTDLTADQLARGVIVGRALRARSEAPATRAGAAAHGTSLAARILPLALGLFLASGAVLIARR